MALGKNYEKDLFSLNFDVLVFCDCLCLIMKVLRDILFLVKILTALFNVSGRVGGVMLHLLWLALHTGILEDGKK